MVRPYDGWKRGRDSLTKLWILNKPGRATETATFYSVDWKSPQSKRRDIETGIRRFEKMIARERPPLARVYEIGTNRLVAEYKHGKRIDLKI